MKGSLFLHNIFLHFEKNYDMIKHIQEKISSSCQSLTNFLSFKKNKN